MGLLKTRKVSHVAFVKRIIIIGAISMVVELTRTERMRFF